MPNCIEGGDPQAAQWTTSDPWTVPAHPCLADPGVQTQCFLSFCKPELECKENTAWAFKTVLSFTTDLPQIQSDLWTVGLAESPFKCFNRERWCNRERWLLEKLQELRRERWITDLHFQVFLQALGVTNHLHPEAWDADQIQNLFH